MNKDEKCWICGRPRGIEQRRESWGLDCPIVFVPQADDTTDAPAYYPNDLIINAGVWRNGGSNSATHICNQCLRVGIRAIKLAVSDLLGELDEGHDKDSEIASLTERQARLQAKYHQLCYDHDRMQDRLADVLQRFDAAGGKADMAIQTARWEVSRGHIANAQG